MRAAATSFSDVHGRGRASDGPIVLFSNQRVTDRAAYVGIASTQPLSNYRHPTVPSGAGYVRGIVFDLSSSNTESWIS